MRVRLCVLFVPVCARVCARVSACTPWCLHMLSGLRAPARWRKGRLLGTGAFGKVYIALDDDTGAEYAVKVVDLVTGGDAPTKAVDALEAEMAMLQQLSHPRIVEYLGTDRTQEALCIFMEYVPGVCRHVRCFVCDTCKSVVCLAGCADPSPPPHRFLPILCATAALHCAAAE